MNTFKKKAKQFISTLCNHISSKSLLISYFARAARCWNPINLSVISDTYEKRFHNLLQKFVDGKLITSLFADETKSEFHKFASDVVRKNKALFRSYDVKPFNIDGCYIEYLKYNIHYKSFAHVLKIFATLFNGQVDVKRGFSLNKQLVVENMSETSFIAQRFIKDDMLLSDYHPHDIPIAKELIQSVRNSNAAFKEASKQKTEWEKKEEKDQRLASIEEEITQLNLKKPSMEEDIKEYHVETKKYAFDTKKKEKFRIAKTFKWVKESC